MIENLIEQTEKNFIKYTKNDSGLMLKVKKLDEKVIQIIVEISEIYKVQNEKENVNYFLSLFTNLKFNII